MFPIKGQGFEGSGSGMVRVSGSFAQATNAPLLNATIRPSKGNYGITQLATGVYQFAYQQAFQSVVSAGAQIGDAAGAGASNGTALRTALAGYTIVSQDFMTTQASNANYAVDTTNKKLLILVFNSSNNALANVPANTRLSFDFTFAQSSENK